MRKLVYFALGFCAGCALLAYRILSVSIPLFLSLTFLLAAVWILAGRQERMQIAVYPVLGLLSVLTWFGIFERWYLADLDALQGKTESISIVLSDFSEATDYGTAANGILMRNGKPYPVRVYLDREDILPPGTRLTGSFRLRVTIPQSRADSPYYQSRGIFLLAYEEECTAGQPEFHWWCVPARLRKSIGLLLQSNLPTDVQPFARALLLGDSSQLDYATNTALKESGIRHVVAVSGLHVTILFTILNLITGKRRFLTPLLGIPLLVLFAAVAGFSPSVNRAAIMIGLMLLSRLFDREYDPPTALAFACLVILTVNPLAVTSVSFQLSFACVAGILLFQKRMDAYIQTKVPEGRLLRKLSASVSITLSAMSLTAPLTALYFGTISLVSIATNLLTLPVVTLTFVGLVILCCTGVVLPAAATFLGWILAWPVRYVLLIAESMAKLPLACVYTVSPYICLWLIYVYALLAVFLLMPRKKPLVPICCAGLALSCALALSWLEPMLDSVRLTVLDVGQGQSILLQSEGKTFLIDCGGDDAEDSADLAAQWVLSQGISHLDGVIVTHYDEDHFGGVEHLLTRLDADLLLTPYSVPIPPLPVISGKQLFVREPVQINLTQGRITVFGPIYSGHDNENSLCILFESEECDILITGDRGSFGERMLLRKYEVPHVDVLVAGHHGASDAVCQELLRAVTPDTVMISVGKGNRYGHPAQDTLQRLESFGCQILRTDLQGTILYRR